MKKEKTLIELLEEQKELYKEILEYNKAREEYMAFFTAPVPLWVILIATIATIATICVIVNL